MIGAAGDVMQIIEIVTMFPPGRPIIIRSLKTACIPTKSVGTYAPPASCVAHKVVVALREEDRGDDAHH